MTYPSCSRLSRLLRAALIPLLLFSMLAASAGRFHSADSDDHSSKVKRYEHKITHTVWKKTTLHKYMPLIRPAQHGTTSWNAGVSATAVLAVSLLPVIYLRLKRMLLYPLKFTSQFVDYA